MKHILYTGYNVFPYGFAQTQKELLIAKGLVNQGCTVTVLCRYGTYKNGQHDNVSATGIFEGIPYKYFTGTAYRPESFIKRNILKTFAVFNEIFYIAAAKIKGKASAMLITTNTFDSLLFYTVLGKILRIKTVIDVQEYWQAVGHHHPLGDKLYDNFCFRLADKALCISEFLIQHAAKTKNPQALLKIPCAVDFSKFEVIYPVKGIDFKYFIFCGSATYFPVVEFIIDSYNLISNTDVHLVLVCGNGKQEHFNRIENKIAQSPNKEFIHYKRNISYEELSGLYQHSLAALAPLRDTVQDVARFPHKSGEYCASGRPIITTAVGEMKYYFMDGVNGYVAEKYDTQQFADKMIEASSDLKRTEEIAAKSREMGLQNFDYNVLGERIYNFVFNIKK